MDAWPTPIRPWNSKPNKSLFCTATCPPACWRVLPRRHSAAVEWSVVPHRHFSSGVTILWIVAGARALLIYNYRRTTLPDGQRRLASLDVGRDHHGRRRLGRQCLFSDAGNPSPTNWCSCSCSVA